MGGGLVYRGGVIAVIFVLTAFAPNSAQAQAALPSAFAPVATPLIDPDLLKPPQAPPRVDADKFNADRSAKGVSAWSIPRGIDLGTYQLQFDANHTSAVRAPRIDMDSGESANLSKIAPGKRQESALPNYFGFKLSAPTH